MRVLVCGGRDYDDFEAVWKELSKLPQGTVVIEGGARGADHRAKQAAESLLFTVIEFPANWVLYGRAAGAIRNRKMLEEGAPDLVLAFPGGRGTANMVGLARAAGVEVREIHDEDEVGAQ